jgi:hypothetical protein
MRGQDPKGRVRLSLASSVVKWDLDNGRAMKGAASRKVLALIRQLQDEGRI